MKLLCNVKKMMYKVEGVQNKHVIDMSWMRMESNKVYYEHLKNVVQLTETMVLQGLRLWRHLIGFKMHNNYMFENYYFITFRYARENKHHSSHAFSEMSMARVIHFASSQLEKTVDLHVYISGPT